MDIIHTVNKQDRTGFMKMFLFKKNLFQKLIFVLSINKTKKIRENQNVTLYTHGVEERLKKNRLHWLVVLFFGRDVLHLMMHFRVAHCYNNAAWVNWCIDAVHSFDRN